MIDSAALLDELIERNAKEAEFQRLFSEHPFLFSRTLRLRHEPTEVVPLGRRGRSEPDFVLFPAGKNPLGVYGVVEIKRASTKLIVERRKGLISLSESARTAVDQVAAYAKELDRPPVVNEGHLVLLGSRGHLFIIAGLSDELAKHPDLHERELLPMNCELIPYDRLLHLFRRTIPPRVHVLVPELTIVGGTVAFATLTDFNELSSISFGSSAWEAESAEVFRAISELKPRGGTTVRVAREIASGALVGAAALRHDLPLAGAYPAKGDEIYMPAIGVREGYRGMRMTDGTAVSDSQMEDVFRQAQHQRGDTMPPIWSVDRNDDTAMARLLTRHGFAVLKSRQSDYYLWLRAGGLPPEWWRERAAG